MTFACCVHAAQEKTISLSEIEDRPLSLRSHVGDSGQFTWWFPAKADAYILPICAGVAVDASREDLMHWLRQGSPWSLSELPALGLQYADQLMVVICPWPHYAELIVSDRLGIRFSFPPGRHQATPCEIVVMRRGSDPLAVARAFRDWRRNAPTIGSIPRPRPLSQKMADLENASRLLGAPHFYLWGPALFSRHDIPRNKWVAFARALTNAPSGSFGHRITERFTPDQRGALQELAQADWPMNYLTASVASAIDTVLSDRSLLAGSATGSVAEVIQRNSQTLAGACKEFLNPPVSWGDGLSAHLLNALSDAGIERALLLLSDLYSRSLRPDVAARAHELGYLLGPYDSYHSVHSPNAGPDDTWETAQFDQAAYKQGRIINADGSGHAGFRAKGYHFSPQAAWPYVQQRVNGIVSNTAYSAWFIDCDATAECFDDFSLAHPATRNDSIKLRRRRLSWLESEHRMVVGSEGGSVLFSDVIHFGHGVHTPYIGHLDPSFRDRQSPHFLGRYWPSDTPEQSFKAVPVPSSLRVPYFDPTVRIPLYQAALGDEVIATHHWGFDSLKFKDLGLIRELMEILYMVPPMYHLNRETWPQRRERILKHLAFWGPIHRELAPAPLIGFEILSKDRLVQRTTFRTKAGEVMVTVNFGETSRAHYPAHSATVAGSTDVHQRVFRAGQIHQ